MARSAYLPIAADRYEACVRTIRFRGLDLRGVSLRAQVRLRPDTPGTPLADLLTVTNGNAEGLRLIDYAIEDGVPVTTIEMVVNETTIEALPYAGELGDATVLSYDLQATIAGRKRKLTWGEFVVIAGVTGADAAPSDRPAGYGGGQVWGSWSTATVTFDQATADVTLVAIDLIDDQLGGWIARQAADHQRMADRALLYGVSREAEQRLFAAEATEIAFADDFYRVGYNRMPSFDAVPDRELVNGPAQIDGRGLLVTGDLAVGLLRPAPGDVTVIVEVDMPAHDGTLRVIGSYVGSVIESRVAVYRSVTGIYALQAYHPSTGLQFVGDLDDPAARRMRVAFTIGATMTRASFAGRAPVSLTIARPPGLLRLWFGLLSAGFGDPLNGRVLRAALYPFAVTDAMLRAMSGGPLPDDDVADLIDSRLQTHDQDSEAHELAPARAALEQADSKTGLWSVAAADSFAGADGALTTAPTGGQTWVAIGGNAIHRIGNVAKSPDAALRGTYLAAATPDGQIEADLDPGTGSSEASLYLRWQSNGNHLLLQRTPAGMIGLFRFVGGTSAIISPPSIFRPIVAGERFKVRLVGERIWVFRIAGGEEELLIDLTEPMYAAAGNHGMRLLGSGSVDNFRILKREAL